MGGGIYIRLHDKLALHALWLQGKPLQDSIVPVAIEALDVFEHLRPLVNEQTDGAATVKVFLALHEVRPDVAEL